MLQSLHEHRRLVECPGNGCTIQLPMQTTKG